MNHPKVKTIDSSRAISRSELDLAVRLAELQRSGNPDIRIRISDEQTLSISGGCTPETPTANVVRQALSDAKAGKRWSLQRLRSTISRYQREGRW